MRFLLSLIPVFLLANSAYAQPTAHGVNVALMREQQERNRPLFSLALSGEAELINLNRRRAELDALLTSSLGSEWSPTHRAPLPESLENRIEALPEERKGPIKEAAFLLGLTADSAAAEYELQKRMAIRMVVAALGAIGVVVGVAVWRVRRRSRMAS